MVTPNNNGNGSLSDEQGEREGQDCSSEMIKAEPVGEDETEVIEFNVSDEEDSPDDRPLDKVLSIQSSIYQNNINANNNKADDDINDFSGNGTNTYTINVSLYTRLY